jgi:hypothetical protein
VSLRAHQPRRADRLSDIIAGLAAGPSDTVALKDVVAAVGDRSFGALLVLFALPNLVAGAVPGLTAILGLPLVLLSLQLLVALERPWLPARLARLEVRREVLRGFADQVVPRLRRLERALRPRLLLLTAPLAERLIGAACLALSLLIFLPIPFANLAPAIGIVLFGLAVLERDGVVAVLAVALAGASIALFGGVALALAKAAAFALRP